MIRTLVIIAAAGFVLCIASFAGAFAIAGGPFWIEDGRFHRWSFEGHGDREGWHGRVDRDQSAAEAVQKRALTWTGGDRLETDLPADIRYTQDANTQLTIEAPDEVLKHLVIRDGRITMDEDGVDFDRITIILHAPNVTRFDLSGAQQLTIDGYRQDVLDLRISGSADVTAVGEVKTVKLDITGSGQADLGHLDAEAAQVDISGSGEAAIAPRKSADIRISGNGKIDLLTRPTDLRTDITGMGQIDQSDDGQD